MGVPPVIIHFDGIFPKSSSDKGVPPWPWKLPNDWGPNIYGLSRPSFRRRLLSEEPQAISRHETTEELKDIEAQQKMNIGMLDVGVLMNWIRG